MAEDPSVHIQLGVEYCQRSGSPLRGDLYLPRDQAHAVPLLVAVHGGGWQSGSPRSFQHWGPYLARRGYGLFAVHYRLASAETKAFPEAFYDVRAAVRFIRQNSRKFRVDAERLGVLGQSAGGHLAALVALTDDDQRFTGDDEPYPGTSAAVAAAVCVYGIYDLAAHWNHEVSSRPGRQFTARFLGTDLTEDRAPYFHASPLSYVSTKQNSPAFLIAYGLEDDIVPPALQSKPFIHALNQVGFYVRSAAVPGAGHFWLSERIEEEHSFSGFLAPRMMSFLGDKLAGKQRDD